jgi:GNAT superfamily N-acetyltransferase
VSIRAEVVRLRADQIEPAGALLARAFIHDPLAVHMLPDESQRSLLLPAHFSPFVRYGVLFGEVYTTPLLEGVAVWLSPGAGELTPERAARAGLDRIAAATGADSWRRFSQAMEFLEGAHARAVPTSHWYLPLLGVDSGRQRQGVGGALLQPVFAQADAAGLPCYLETLEPTNVAFYERHGFATVGTGREPTSGLLYWGMMRAPRPRSDAKA